MSRTGNDPLVGEDYQAELRRIAAESVPSPVGGNKKGMKYKTKNSPGESGEEDLDALLDAPLVFSDEEEDSDPGTSTQYDYAVTTPSGATLPVLTEREVEYYEDRARRYTADHRFTSVTDLQDLDRVLSSELVLHRYDVWLTLGQDYWGNAVSEKDLLKYIKDLSVPLQTLKKSMSLDKATRDKDQGADFVGWLENVRRRAKEFGIMRNQQFVMAITLFHELIAQLQVHVNADDIERKEMGLSPEEVIKWIWEDLIPRFNEVDEHFRKGEDGYEGQRLWVGEL